MLNGSTLEGQLATAVEALELKGKLLTASAGSFQRSNQTQLWNHTALDVRACYNEIVNLMFESGWPAHMSVVGSFGIGKSNMIPYILRRRWKDNELTQFPVYMHEVDAYSVVAMLVWAKSSMRLQSSFRWRTQFRFVSWPTYFEDRFTWRSLR